MTGQHKTQKYIIYDFELEVFKKAIDLALPVDKELKSKLVSNIKSREINGLQCPYNKNDRPCSMEGV